MKKHEKLAVVAAAAMMASSLTAAEAIRIGGLFDLSGKALAIFDRSEMAADDLVPAVGDKFVARVHHDGMRGGLVVLTRKPLREEEARPGVEQALGGVDVQ